MTSMRNGRMPPGLLVAKLGEMECGQFVGKAVWENFLVCFTQGMDRLLGVAGIIIFFVIMDHSPIPYV